MKGDVILLFLALWPCVGALAGYLIGRRSKKGRDYFADFVVVSEFAVIAVLFVKVLNGAEYTFRISDICSRGLYLKMDGFRALYGSIAVLMWMMTTIFSREYFGHYRNRNRYYLFMLITFGATVGVFLSADLFTTFVFFEVMSMASYVMVVHDEKPAAMRAGDTYLAVAVLGGMVMLMGIFLLYHAVGTLDMDLLLDACRAYEDKKTLYLAASLMLFGFGAKAGMFPLHIWLPKAHPVAPAPASALLSGILTKAGVFGVLVIGSNLFLHDEKWGFMILCFGVITMFLGAVLAVFSIDLKRTLACSSMSQIGFILTGAGMQGLLGEENALAVRGTLLHMVNHSLLKLVLFMAAGAVFMNLHKLDLNEIRGFGRKKPLLNFIFLMGVLGITGVPLWNGYISKTLIHESIVEFIWEFKDYTVWSGFFRGVEGIFLFSGGLTAAYMLKLYVALFVEKNPYHQDKMDSFNGRYMSRESTFALLGSAVILPLLGMLPYRLMNGIASMGQTFMHGEEPAHMVNYFSWTNIRGGLASLSIGVIVYLMVIRRCLMKEDENGNRVYVNVWPVWLDLEDRIYRPLLLKILPFVGAFAGRLCDRFADSVVWLVRKTIMRPKKESKRVVEFTFMRELTNVKRIQRQIFNSLSFSLLLFCTGLCSALIYMLFVIL